MSCIWAVEKFIWKYQDSSVSNGFLTECCVPWDANQFYAKTDPAYRVSTPLHNNFLSISVKSKSCFPKWWMHNNIDKPPVARSATTTDVEKPFHTHMNSTSKFWTVPYGIRQQNPWIYARKIQDISRPSFSGYSGTFLFNQERVWRNTGKIFPLPTWYLRISLQARS